MKHTFGGLISVNLTYRLTNKQENVTRRNQRRHDRFELQHDTIDFGIADTNPYIHNKHHQRPSVSIIDNNKHIWHFVDVLALTSKDIV